MSWKRGGGVLIAVDEEFTATRIDFLDDNYFSSIRVDIVIVRVSTEASSTIVVNTYIPPATSMADY